MTPVPNKVFDRIKALLNFNEENNATENEVAIATSIVKKMLSQYQLSMADIENNEVGEDIQEEEIDAGVSVLRTWHYSLMRVLSKNFDCKYLLNTYRYGYQKSDGSTVYNRRGYRVFLVIGHDSDVEMVKWLFVYLSKTLVMMAKRKAKERGIRGGAIHTYTNSFIQGAAGVINSRLEEQRNPVEVIEEEKLQVEQCQALVLVKMDKVEDQLKIRYPKTENVKIGFSNRSGIGNMDGKDAGRKVSLNRPLGKGNHERLQN